MIQAMRQPGMRTRHWDQISSEIGMDLHPGDDFILTRGIEMGLLNYMEVINRVSEIACKEYAIETALTKMEAEWKILNLQVKPVITSWHVSLWYSSSRQSN